MAKNGTPTLRRVLPNQIECWDLCYVRVGEAFKGTSQKSDDPANWVSLPYGSVRNVCKEVPPIVEHRNTAFSINLRGCLGVLGGSPEYDAPQRSEEEGKRLA